jgi:Domain of unknown function (DUF4174)
MPQRITGPYEPKPTGPELPNQRKFDDIVSHRGRRQVLLIFSPSPAKTPYKQLMHDIEENSEDFRARDIELLLILETGRAPREWNYLPGQQSVKARHKFDVRNSDFAVLLLGMDGRVKQRWNGEVDYDTLSAAF